MNKEGSKICFKIGILVIAPIREGKYNVDDVSISVSYPDGIETTDSISGTPSVIYLPRGISTLFEVEWVDKSGEYERKLLSKLAERFHPIHYALDKINKLLSAFKLVKVDRSSGKHIRTIGEQDTLFYLYTINGNPVPGNMNKKSKYSPYKSFKPDPEDITELAKPHINNHTYPIGRRFLRSIELIERGLYTESLIISFAIMDDNIQISLNHVLASAGITSKTKRKKILREITDDRMNKYLGTLLKRYGQRSLFDVWPEGEKAIEWINRRRNEIMHAGDTATRKDACLGLFVSSKTLVELWKTKFIEEKPMPVEIYREAKIKASWSEKPPKWVPTSPDSGKYNFD